jgi:hypothetical protein
VTVFLRVLEPSVDEKEGALLSSIRALRTASLDRATFEVSPEAFQKVPGSPFAYWTSETIRSVFVTNAPFEADGRTVKQGLATADDFRFVRAWWEVAEARCGSRWFPFAKGGSYSPFYADVFLCVNWENDGREVSNFCLPGSDKVASRPQNTHLYFRPGLTWPLRTQRGFGMRAMPEGCVFGHKGPAAFVGSDEPNVLLAILAIATSSVFQVLVELQMAFGSYEVGVIQRTPIPNLNADTVRKLAALARQAWSLKRTLDTTNETSHAFVLPPGLSEKLTGLSRVVVEHELAELQRQIDDEAHQLYGIRPDDLVAFEAVPNGASEEASEGAADDEGDGSDSTTDEDCSWEAAPVFSWLVGVAFGRFDPRLATDLVDAYGVAEGPPYTLVRGRRPIPAEPDPFDALPKRSPGMWPEGEAPVVVPPDIMVDDEGHDDDLHAHVADAAAHTGIPAPEDLRQWLAKEFFPLHIRMYSKSRRKAPIYWQLATPSASYSVWLYIHAFSKDTLFRVQNDYVAPKLAHEERRLESLTAELRAGATAAQRKQLAAQEAFVEELRTFLDEVKRVAPLWNPNLDDGVIINFAPLWRLVPQNKAWQKELKSTWDALCEGKYDWAHLAMHLWPERVVPKCAKDRSLAIAHGLEDVFWIEGADGKWTARKTPTRSIDELVRERTSPAVKAALKSLLEATVGNGKRAGRKGDRRRKTVAAAQGGYA